MKTRAAFRSLPTGTRAIVAWSAVYTVIIIFTCIFYWDAEGGWFFGGGARTDDTITHIERIIFYAIVLGGFIISWLIGCRIQVNIEEAMGSTGIKKYVRLRWFDVLFVIAVVIAYVFFKDRIVALAVLSWCYAMENLCWLWKFRKELGLAK